MAEPQQSRLPGTSTGIPGFGGAAAADDGGTYRLLEDSAEKERTPLETGALQTFDVFALIVNKMIGTGIYSAPATIFMLTGRKWLTLVLFFVGFIHAVLRYVIGPSHEPARLARSGVLQAMLCSTAMYLDYASVWPYTGGELIYVGVSSSPS